MPSCELCGRNMKGGGRNVTIEGATMNVCPQCAAKFGGASYDQGKSSYQDSRVKPSWSSPPPSEPVRTTRPVPQRAPSRPKPKPVSSAPLLDDLDLIDNYAEVIRSTRQKKGMSQEELAQRVGERISTLQSIESGRLKPTRKTIRGLERELEISLLEPLSTVPLKMSKGESAGPTLGDVVKVKRKRSQKSED